MFWRKLAELPFKCLDKIDYFAVCENSRECKLKAIWTPKLQFREEKSLFSPRTSFEDISEGKRNDLKDKNMMINWREALATKRGRASLLGSLSNKFFPRV